MTLNIPENWNPEIKWEPNGLRQIYPYIVTPFLRNLPRLASCKSNYFASYDTSQQLLTIPIYGNLYAPHHMFRHPAIQWDFDFHERQMTEGLGHFLSRSRLACWFFLCALFDCDESKVELAKLNAENESEKDSFLRSASVITEVKTNEGKRIDLCIRWRSASGKLCLAVIECKFGHHITHGQLPSYKRYCEEHSSCYHLFLLSRSLDKKSIKIMNSHYNAKIWRRVIWTQLLKKWEIYLIADTHLYEEDFSRFRHTLWNKALNQ